MGRFTMSKIGEKLIIVENGVTVTIEDGKARVKGNVGELVISFPHGIDIIQKERTIQVKRNSHGRKTRSMHGLIRTLLSNAVIGVVKPWEKRLHVVGTGYRVKLQGADLVFDIGYSHQVIFKKVDDISFVVEGSNKIVVRGIDKQKVGEVAMKIKKIKKPDVYKGKGIRYEGEQLKLRPGKKAKTAGAAK